MKSNLVINLIPISFSEDALKVYLKDTVEDDPKGTWKKIFVDQGGEELDEFGKDKVLWDVTAFSGAVEKEIVNPSFSAVKRILGCHLQNYFLERGLIVGTDFIGGTDVYIPQPQVRHPDIKTFKKFSMRFVPPVDQHITRNREWCLQLSFLGFREVTSRPVRNYNSHEGSLSKVVVDNRVKSYSRLTDAEKDSDQTFAFVSKEFSQKLGIPLNLYRTLNKYFNSYNEIEGFYTDHLKGHVVEEIITIFESGFQPIPESQLNFASKESNLLVFGGNQTNVNPYSGLKANGPFRPPENDNYRLIFVFHESDKDYANNLYAFFRRGLKGYPGLYRFVGLNVNLDKERSITFTQEDPVPEVRNRLREISFEPGVKYLAVYISRISKDDPDINRKSYYYQLKKLFLEHNVSSQVVYKLNIEKPVFNYHLPNISIAMLAKLGGVPWRLSRPIKNDLIIGVGAFREKDNVYLGTTVAFRNDGTFVRFDSKKTNSSSQLAEYFQSVVSSISQEQTDIKRIVIHFYKKMSKSEEKIIQRSLEKLGLKIPYVVLTIVEDRDGSFVPYDMEYRGRMPVSGTCVTLKKGVYLLCNNTRYSETTGQKIDDFPFPVQIKVSKSSMQSMQREEVVELIDQVYQFSRMYWVSVKQRGRPVTVEYSEKIAKISSYFREEGLPDTEAANRSLWFL